MRGTFYPPYLQRYTLRGEEPGRMRQRGREWGGGVCSRLGKCQNEILKNGESGGERESEVGERSTAR